MKPTEHEAVFESDRTTPLRPYRKRFFRSEGIAESDGFRIKLYTIRLDDEPAPQATMSAVTTHALRAIPAAAEEESDHHDLGFVILHEGEDANWLLLHWWAHADINCQLMAVQGPDGRFTVTGRPLHACVWEGVVITHEHRAWVRTMMTERPDAEAYLTDVLANGAY